MRRAKSHYSIRAKVLASEVSDSDESISDISMDTCFQIQRDDEELTDESEEEDVLQKKRSFRNSDPSFHENLMVVTPSFLRKSGLSKMTSSKRGGALKALTMEDIDVNDRSNFLRFDSSDFIASTNCPKQSKTMQRKSSSFEDSADEDMSDMLGKATEFEDIDNKKLTSSQRNLEFEFKGTSKDPFLSGDEEFAAMSKKRRKKKKKQKKEQDGGKKDGGIDWDEVDAKGKASLAAYSVAEGNIYPEISKVEAKQFKRSGNAWLEGRYSTNADWKRDASGMVLDIPIPTPKKKDKPKLNRPAGLVTDRIKERPKKSTPPRGRTALSLAEVTAPIAPIPESAKSEGKEHDAHTPLPELMENPTSKPSKTSDRRSLFLRANSMPSFKLGNLQRVFKRSNAPNSETSDGEGLLGESSVHHTAGFREPLFDESINPRGMSSMATPINTQNNVTSTPESNGSPSSSIQRRRSGSVGKATPSSVKCRRRRSESIGEASGGKASKSKSKKDRSSKKEGKTRMKDVSDQARRIKHAAVMNAINTETPQTSLRRIKSLELTKSQETKVEAEDFTLSPSNDFVAGLNVSLKDEKRITRGTYSGSSDGSSYKVPKSEHRRRTTSVSSNNSDDAPDKKSKRKSKRRCSVSSTTRSGRNRRTSHSSEGMDEDIRKSLYSSDDLGDKLSARSDFRGSFSQKSDDGSQEAKLAQQLSHDGVVDEVRKSEKKQRKKVKRRSTSVPKSRVTDAELAAGENKAKEEKSETSRRERSSTHRRPRSTSIPKGAEARAAGEPRKRGGSVEAKARDRGSTHRRGRGSSVPSHRPPRRWSIGEVNPEEAPAEQAHRPNRPRRSLHIEGEVVSSQGVDDAEATIQLRERNESHHYVGFSAAGGSRTPPESAPPDKPSKPSFLSRFAKLDQEATATKQTVARRSMMQRPLLERSFKYNALVPLAKSYTPTF
jgi:hypothetical protein